MQRFDERVDRSGGPDACWPWTGAREKGGVDQATVTRVRRRETWRHVP